MDAIVVVAVLLTCYESLSKFRSGWPPTTCRVILSHDFDYIKVDLCNTFISTIPGPSSTGQAHWHLVIERQLSRSVFCASEHQAPQCCDTCIIMKAAFLMTTVPTFTLVSLLPLLLKTLQVILLRVLLGFY